MFFLSPPKNVSLWIVNEIGYPQKSESNEGFFVTLFLRNFLEVCFAYIILLFVLRCALKGGLRNFKQKWGKSLFIL